MDLGKPAGMQISMEMTFDILLCVNVCSCERVREKERERTSGCLLPLYES